MGLAPHLVRVDHHGCQLQGHQGPRHVERRRAGLQSHGRPRRKPVVVAQARQPLRRRGHRAAADHGPRLILDHEHCLLAVHIEADVVRSHRAVLLSVTSWGSVWMTPWSTADLTAVPGGPPLVFIDTVWWTPDRWCRKESTCRRVTPV